MKGVTPYSYLENVRTTYLINEEGTIVKAFGRVKAAENAQQMLELV